MVGEASLEFRLRKTDETRNYILDEIKYNDLVSEKYKKKCKYLNYVENLQNPVGITSSAVGINICAIIAGIKKYKSIIKKKQKKHHKLALLGKDKSNIIIEILISKALIDSYISHDEFVLLNNVLREYYEMKEEIKNPETSVEYTLYKQ